MHTPITSMRGLIVHIFRVGIFIEKEERISRGEYRVGIMTFGLLSGIVYALIGWTGKVGLIIAAILSLIIFYVPFFNLAVKRAHDLNMAGVCVLTLLVPFWNIYTLIMFGFSVGNNESNQFGDTPLKHIPANNVAYWAAAIAMYAALVVIKLVGMISSLMSGNGDASPFMSADMRANMQQSMMNSYTEVSDESVDTLGK